MTTVTEDLDLPAGTDPGKVVVTVYLAGENGQPLPAAYNATAGKTIVGQHRLAPTAGGSWSLDLAPNADLAPAGTVWARQVSIAQPGGTPFATVPAAGGPYRWDEILADPPGALATAALDAHASDASIHGSGREAAGPSQMTANSATFNAATGSFQMEDVEVSGGGALFHEITVPAGGVRPVWLELDTSVQIDTAGAAVTLAIAPSGTASPALITDAIQHRTKTLPAAGQNEQMSMRVRLAAGVPGSYKVMGSVTAGSGTVAASSFGPSILSAIEH